MGDRTKIEWADATFNPWLGCTRVSAACDFCYAESWARRVGKPELWQGQRHRTSEANWRQPLKWNRQAAAEGRRWRVFCASLADVFDNQVSKQWREDLWGLIKITPNLDWLLLTKRPQNIAKMLPAQFDEGDRWPERWPNVWLGTTVENQEETERRIPHLLAVPARVHFLSCEPLLGPIDLSSWPDWVICGGESGSKARPMHPAWARSLRDQCAAAGVPFFFKQHGEWKPDPTEYLASLTPSPDLHWWGDGHGAESYSRKIGKLAAGRLLDGREHNEFPT